MRKAWTATRWPEYVPELAHEEQVEVVIQINGRVRGKISVDAGLSEDELVERAIADPRIQPIAERQASNQAHRRARSVGESCRRLR